MEELNRYQKAALISNTRRKEKSIELYYQTPNICKCCGEVIKINKSQKVREVRRKIFCNKSCSAIFNNQQREPKDKILKTKEYKPKKKFEFILSLSKKDLIDKHEIYYKFRAVIRKHAHYVFNKHHEHQECKVCGYNTHIEVCHIKSVSSFSDDTLISEINSIDNLVGLCPNHHWEFDNGKIQI
jgi:hypothetical protein